MTYKIAHLVNAHTIEIKHPQKEYFYIIRVLENTIINVKISNRRQISLPTYTITPYDTPLPYEGLSRYHTQGFTLPQFDLTENNNDITIETALS
jgi:alpha-glucosidase